MNINNEIVKIPGRLSNRIVGTVYSTKTGNLIWKGGKTSYGCCVENCEKGFVYKNHLNRHISAVHEGKKPFECDICKKEFSENYSLTSHIAAVHEGKKPFECDICKKAFSENGSLTEHIAAVHEGKKPFKCQICKKEFARNGDLTKHVSAVHEGKKPFKCHICKNAFFQKGDLAKHISAVHEGKKPFKCQICKKEFTQNGSLTEHIAAVHEGKKPFKCQICKKEFARNGNLTIHVSAVHVGKKPFKCQICKKEFARNGDLAKHVLAIHTPKILECQICSNLVSRIRPCKTINNILVNTCNVCFSKITGKNIRIETSMSNHLDIHFHPEYRICSDTSLNGNVCLKYRPDGVWASSNMVLHFECDEHQHKGSNYSCDEKRISDLYDEFPGKTYIVVRINPHSYKAPQNTIKPTQEQRLHLLVKVMKACLTKTWKTKIHVVYLFYSADNKNITQNFSKTMLYDQIDIDHFCK